MKNFSYNGTDKSFIDCIQALSRSIENKSSSPDFRELFFKLIEKRDQLPENIPEEATNNFIYCLVEIAYSDPDQREALKALNALFRFVKSDLNVFSHFKPTRVLIRKLKLDKYLISSSSEVMENILDFAIFLLRYYESVDYEDFSDLATIIGKIKRAELHRVWIDIEEIIGRLDGFDNSSKQNLKNTSEAFGEIFSYMDKIKKDVEACKLMVRSQPGETNLRQIENEYNNQEKASMQKKFNEFEKKLDRLKFQGQGQGEDMGAYRDDYSGVVRGGLRGNEAREMQDQMEEMRKLMIARFEKIESELFLAKTVKAPGLDREKEAMGYETFQNLASAISNLSDRIGALEKGQGDPRNDWMGMKANDLDLKIKVSTMEKKLDGLTDRLASFQPFAKTPNEIDKLKQDFDLLENRVTKDIGNVVDSYRRADQAIQNDLKRLMDIASSMQSDIEELQNNFTSGATDLGLKDKNYDNEFLKRKLNGLESKIDKQPTKADYEFLLDKISTLENEKGLGGKPSLARSGDMTRSSNPYLKDQDPHKDNVSYNLNELNKLFEMKDYDNKIANLERLVKEHNQTLSEKIKQHEKETYIKFNQMDMKTLELRMEEIEKRSSSSQQLLNQSIKGDTSNIQVALKILEAKIGTIEKNASDETLKLQNALNELKNMKQDTSKSPFKNEPTSPTKVPANKQDIDRIEKFIQEWINKQALSKIHKIMNANTTPTDKMNKFEWVIQNIEFISAALSEKLIIWSEEAILDPQENSPNRDALTTAKHTSDAVIVLIGLIKEAAAAPPTSREVMHNYLSFLEIMLFSDVNLDKAMKTGVLDMIMYILDPANNYTIDEKKGALKCTLPCSRFSSTVNVVFGIKKNLKIILEMLAKPWDSDALFILTNFLAKVFVHDYKLGVVPEESRELVKLMFTNLTKFANTGGEELIEEMLQTLVYVTRTDAHLDLIESPQLFQGVIDFAKRASEPEIKGLAISVLRNSSRKVAFAEYFKAQGIN